MRNSDFQSMRFVKRSSWTDRNELDWEDYLSFSFATGPLRGRGEISPSNEHVKFICTRGSSRESGSCEVEYAIVVQQLINSASSQRIGMAVRRSSNNKKNL